MDMDLSAPKKNNLIVFVIRGTWHFHYHKSTISSLGARGYRVLALFDRKWSKRDPVDLIEQYKKDNAWFDYGWGKPRTDWWRHVLFHSRELLTYRRYLVVKGQSRYYTTHWRAYLARTVQAVLKFPLMERMLMTHVAGACLRGVENIASPDCHIVAHLRSLSPACVMASPVTMRFSSCDLEYLKAAVWLHIPTALPVISWDNLTTKGIIHVWPDTILAWNDVQKKELEDHHNFPPARVCITGGPVFDGWFAGLKSSRSREEFCHQYGLRASDAIIMYLGSSDARPARDETWMVEAIRSSLDRASDPKIQKTQIIVRPHPANFRCYERLNLPDVIIVPKNGSLPSSSEGLNLFYDSIMNSVCTIVGVDTSGIIDTMIAGAPGVAILTDEYRAKQSDAAHFRQIIDADALEFIKSPEEFPAILTSFLDGRDTKKEKRMAFITRYIRPQGRKRAAGDIVAEEIEKLIQKQIHRI